MFQLEYINFLGFVELYLVIITGGVLDSFLGLSVNVIKSVVINGNLQTPIINFFFCEEFLSLS